MARYAPPIPFNIAEVTDIQNQKIDCFLKQVWYRSTKIRSICLVQERCVILTKTERWNAWRFPKYLKFTDFFCCWKSSSAQIQPVGSLYIPFISKWKWGEKRVNKLQVELYDGRSSSAESLVQEPPITLHKNLINLKLCEPVQKHLHYER